MKQLLLLLSIITMISCNNTQHSKVYPGVEALIHRIVPQWEEKLFIDSIDSENGHDVFEIYGEKNKIILKGSSPVAVASALNWYLKYYCHCQISQAGINLTLPSKLPVLTKKIHIVSPYKYRYFLNYCTFNYTMSFWDWGRWQRELDWMALQGINLVLAVNGMEEVWQNTLKKLNFDDKEIADFICGPGYQAWWLMGNLQGWGGPVSERWIKNRTALQKNILSYLREMRMEPVFQGFYGMVPTTLKSNYPKADIRSTGLWCQYIRPDFIMPTDTFFDFFAQIYYHELQKLYGKAKFYGGDPFHEGSIPQVDLKSCAANIERSMQKASQGSTWVLQGWIDNPSPKLLAGVNKQRTLVIDLFNETNPGWKVSHGFSGCRWLFCTINNFGGRTGIYAKLDSTLINLDQARKSQYGQQMEGIGVIPEGIHLNPFIFDFIFELAWRDELPDPKKWAQDYSFFRYGQQMINARKAWEILSQSIYNIPMHFDEPQNVICSRPSLQWNKSAPWGLGPIHYKQVQLKQACSLLLECSEDLKNQDTYQYDVVDFTHQYLLGTAEDLYLNICKSFQSKNKTEFHSGIKKFLNLIKDLDTLMATRKEFLLGSWINQAKAIATDSSQRNLFEQNARMLITTWGYGKQHEVLNDYAHREWAGLIGTYYYDRWKMFLDDLSDQMEGKKAKKIDFAQMEEHWTQLHDPYPTVTDGDAVERAKKMFEKYK